MNAFGPVNWSVVFLPQTPIVEIIVRGTVVYAAIFVLLRVLRKRQSGSLSMSDLLVIVLIADASQNAMAGDYKSIPDGILLIVTILFWSYVIDRLADAFPMVARFVHPPPRLLIKDGRLLPRHLREEMITRDELMTQLREQGIDDLARVKVAYMEGDGRISIVDRHGRRHNPPPAPTG